MKKVIVRGNRNIYCPKDEYVAGTVESLFEKINVYSFVNVEVLDNTEEDSAFVDFTIYAVGESAPMPTVLAEHICSVINELGFRLATICSMRNNNPGAWMASA